MKLLKAVEMLIQYGYFVFYVGDALGFDTLAAQTVILLKEKYSFIKLIIALPCKNHNCKWTHKDKLIFEDIQRKADEIIYCSEAYYEGYMQKRNSFMVNNSDICICYCRKEFGGSVYTKNYAKTKGIALVEL